MYKNFLTVILVSMIQATNVLSSKSNTNALVINTQQESQESVAETEEFKALISTIHKLKEKQKKHHTCLF